jgi:hypothetical protein
VIKYSFRHFIQRLEFPAETPSQTSDIVFLPTLCGLHEVLNFHVCVNLRKYLLQMAWKSGRRRVGHVPFTRLQCLCILNDWILRCLADEAGQVWELARAWLLTTNCGMRREVPSPLYSWTVVARAVWISGAGVQLLGHPSKEVEVLTNSMMWRRGGPLRILLVDFPDSWRLCGIVSAKLIISSFAFKSALPTKPPGWVTVTPLFLGDLIEQQVCELDGLIECSLSTLVPHLFFLIFLNDLLLFIWQLQFPHVACQVNGLLLMNSLTWGAVLEGLQAHARAYRRSRPLFHIRYYRWPIGGRSPSFFLAPVEIVKRIFQNICRPYIPLFILIKGVI